MADGDGLTTLIRETEEQYIQDFCNAYKDEFTTPDGFVIICKYLEQTAKHVCCGGDGGAFQPVRAQRILWAKFILMNPSERIILTDTQTKNTIFFLTRSRHPHVVICRKLGDKWNLISSFAVGGKRAEKYRNGKPPYEFFKPQT